MERKKFDIFRSNRSERCSEGPFPPSMTDLAPVLSIAEILRNPDVLLQKQRTMIYDSSDCEIYPEDSFGNDVQDAIFPAIDKTSGLDDIGKRDEPLPDKPRAEDTPAPEESEPESSKE